MRKEAISVYRFEELKPKVKEKVLNIFREQEEHCFLSENLTEFLKDELEKNKIIYNDSLKVYYSLSYCQGDGFCFIGNFKYKGYDVAIKHNSRYYNERSTEIYIYKLNKEYDKIEAEEKVYNKFKELYYSICQNLEKIGYEEIETDLSEDNIKENIEANDYEFLLDGSIFRSDV